MSEVAVTSEFGTHVSREEIELRRKAMDADVWLFIKWVCGHGADDIARFHRPLAYFLAGDAVRLAGCLNTYQSEVVSQIKADLERREIDWNTPDGVRKLKRLLQRVNDRISRSMGKTSIGLDVVLWKASVNPDINILIASKSDDAAWAMCETIGNMMRSDAYKLYYSDRLFPSNPEGSITKKWIRMYGRKSANQDTIEARGVTSQTYGRHYHEIYCDDLTSTEAKQGEATVQDAIRFISSLQGISIAERWGGTRYMFNGTIQGPRDDHAKISQNPEFISLVIPIWRHPKGKWTIKNMMDDGIPVLPELYDVDACRLKREDTLANDSLGKISWLQNFLMCAHESGTMQFTADLLLRQMFTWVTVSDPASKEKRRKIRRYLYDDEDNPKQSPDLEPRACRCYRKCGTMQHAFIQFDPFVTPRIFGVDQAISPEGDMWSVGVTTVDSHGHKYQLKGMYDRGYWKMIPAIQKLFSIWGGIANPPVKIGMESNTWQRTSAEWMKRSEEMQYFARRIHKLPPSFTAKVTRIYNDIYAGLEEGSLWLDPEDDTFQRCALDYNAADPDKQWDDPLDAVAMSIQTHKYAAADMDESAMKTFVQEQDREFSRACDNGTWLDTSTEFMEGLSWAN